LATDRSTGALSPLRVVLTGSESTGKTTLAVELARHFRTVSAPEFVRRYLEGRSKPLDRGDVEPIARGQMAGEDEQARRARGVLICDTDLVSTMVYARHYYGECAPWIEHAARGRKADLYLLMDIDVPWIPDPQRDGGQLRDEVQSLFREALASVGASVVLISGSWAQRREVAIEAIEALLTRQRPQAAT
jgi:NadR type nicotinamide-nucleotide adenylyltransferase